ncbi:MAG: class I SAM-dependent methyltransferase [Candidatus Limnocylindria bacterium]
MYSKDYYQCFREGPGIAGGYDQVPTYLRNRLAEMARRCGPGSLLDLGCATGLFVAYARSQGWNAVGVETSSWAASEGRKRFGVEIFECPLEDVPIAPATFDVVHANHVLEHVADPVGTLRSAFRLLRPGGLLYVEVPQELKQPLADWIVALRHPRQPTAFAPNYHLLYFSKRGLLLAARRAGFEMESLRNLRHTEDLKKRPLPLDVARRLIYRLEAGVQRAPLYVLTARRPKE